MESATDVDFELQRADQSEKSLSVKLLFSLH